MDEGVFADAAIRARLSSFAQRRVDVTRREPSVDRLQRRLLGGVGLVASCVLVRGELLAVQRGFAGANEYGRFLDGVLRDAPRFERLLQDTTLEGRIARAELRVAGRVPGMMDELRSLLGLACGEASVRVRSLATRFALDRGDLEAARAFAAHGGAVAPELEAELCFAERRPLDALRLLAGVAVGHSLEVDLLRARSLHELERAPEARSILELWRDGTGDGSGRVRDAIAHLDAPGHRHDGGEGGTENEDFDRTTLSR